MLGNNSLGARCLGDPLHSRTFESIETSRQLALPLRFAKNLKPVLISSNSDRLASLCHRDQPG